MAPWLASPALAICNTVGLVTTCTDISGGGFIGFDNATLDGVTFLGPLLHVASVFDLVTNAVRAFARADHHDRSR